MGFFTDWKVKSKSGLSTGEYVADFIKSEDHSVKSLKNADETELKSAYEMLSNTELGIFLNELSKLEKIPELNSTNVPCFSTMENGASRLNELLSFSPDGLTFSEIGYQLMNSVTEAAQKKYGENQAKLAAMMELVELSHTRPIIVKPTPWGNYLIQYTFSEKKDVLKKLLLRSACVQNILYGTFHGFVKYGDLVSFLSHSTQLRRRTNVRYLIDFILKDSEYEILLSNIGWEV